MEFYKKHAQFLSWLLLDLQLLGHTEGGVRWEQVVRNERMLGMWGPFGIMRQRILLHGLGRESRICKGKFCERRVCFWLEARESQESPSPLELAGWFLLYSCLVAKSIYSADKYLTIYWRTPNRTVKDHSIYCVVCFFVCLICFLNQIPNKIGIRARRS